MKERRRFSAEFKARVAREALKEHKTIAELSAEVGVHANQISQWKKQLIEALPEVFSRRREHLDHRQGETPLLEHGRTLGRACRSPRQGV